MNMNFIKKMKKTILILAIILGINANSQDKRFTFYGYSDPNATIQDGFNIGFGIEYQMENIYIKTQIFAFPNLRGKDYFEWSTIPFTSFNKHLLFDDLRLYTGFKLGLIKRDVIHPFIGFESGIDYYFDNKFYIGLICSEDLRTDGKEWENDIPNYWRFSGFIKIGFQW